jgi:CheY-like chemotaxis protein
MHRLFHSFSQVDSGISRNFGGTGLGLSITRGLARLLGGDCWAESVEGQGSTFYLTAAKTSAKDAERPKAYPAGPSRQALLYAPRDLASSVIHANLLAFGITVRVADIGEDTKLAAQPDLVLVDMDEPSINGDTLQRLRDRHQSSKVSLPGSVLFRRLTLASLVHLPRDFDRRLQI